MRRVKEWIVIGMCGVVLQAAAAQARVIEVTADKDSRYKIAGQGKPSISAHVGEQLLLRITARRGKSWDLLTAPFTGSHCCAQKTAPRSRMEPAVAAGTE